MTTTEVATNNKNNKQEMFVVDMKYLSLDMCIDDAQQQSNKVFSIVNLVRGQPPRKKIKVKDLKPIIFVQLNSRLGKAKPVMLKCLLDTGASSSLLAKKFSRKLRLKKGASTKTVWTTPGGDLQTTHKCQCTFAFPEFFCNRVIEWDLLVITPKISPTLDPSTSLTK